MTDEKPLTSEEMIKRAREELSRPPSAPDPTIRDREEIEQEAEAATPSVRELTRPQTSTRRPARARRVERKPPAGFGDTRSSGPAVAAVAMAILLLTIGIIAFAAIGSGTP